MINQYIPQYNRKEIAKELTEYVLSDSFFSENIKTEKLEQKLANFLKVKYCSCVPSGTLALVIALLAHGVKAGDKVLIPNITMMSTQAAVDLIGAKPVLMDISPTNLCLDIHKAKEYIENNTVKAIIYVTLNGRSHGMGELQEFYDFCTGYKIGLIEDNAQSFGSKHNDFTFISTPKNGIGCFSMSFHKLLSSGQGGFIVTDNDYFGNKIKELKNVGRISGGADIHENFGINAKYTDIQAIIALNQLKDLGNRIGCKKTIYQTYIKNLPCIPQIKTLDTDHSYTTPWFVDIYVENRNNLQSFLKENGIQTRAIYPALNTQKINGGQSFNTLAELFARKGLWLPSSMTLSLEEINYVCKKIQEFYELENKNVL